MKLIDLKRLGRWFAREAVPALGDIAKSTVIRELRNADLTDEINTVAKAVNDRALAELIVMSVRSELIRRVEKL